MVTQAPLEEGGGAEVQGITPEEAAVEIVDAAESPELALRIPIGDEARAILAARHAAHDDTPFIADAPVPTAGGNQ